MRPHYNPHPRQRRGLTVLTAALLTACLAACVSGVVFGSAQDAGPESAAPAGEEREFKSTVPEHVPSKPGEIISLKVRESFVKAYEKCRDEEGRTDPKKIELHLQIINFGDGTGYRSVEGNFDSIRRQSQNAPPTKQGANTCATTRNERVADSPGNRFRYRAKVRDARGAQVGRWAWDVFLVPAP